MFQWCFRLIGLVSRSSNIPRDLRGTWPHSPSLKFVGLLLVKKRSLRQSRCDWHVSAGPLGPYILAHGGLTLATPSGLAGKQSLGKIGERGRSKKVAGRIGLPMLQNRPQESWNEVNSMPTHKPHFGAICGLIWQKWQTGNAAGQLNWPPTPSSSSSSSWHTDGLCCGYFCFLCIHRERTKPGVWCCCFTALILTHGISSN